MNETDDDNAEAYPHRYLDTLREIADAGMDLAVPAALYYCAENNVPSPQWLTERASKLLNAVLHVEDQTGRKRMRQQIMDYRKWQRHFTRFDAVEAAQEARVDLQKELEKIKQLKDRKARRIANELKSTLDRLGPSDETLFAAVGYQLKDTGAAVGDEAIRKSYQQLSKEKREGTMNRKYHCFNPRFLRRIGAGDNLDKKVKGRTGSKRVP